MVNTELYVGTKMSAEQLQARLTTQRAVCLNPNKKGFKKAQRKDWKKGL